MCCCTDGKPICKSEWAPEANKLCLPVEEYSSLRRCHPNIQCPKCSLTGINSTLWSQLIINLEEMFQFSKTTKANAFLQSQANWNTAGLEIWKINFECNEDIDNYLVDYMKTSLVETLLNDMDNVRKSFKYFADIIKHENHETTDTNENEYDFQKWLIISLSLNAMFALIFVTKVFLSCKQHKNTAQTNHGTASDANTLQNAANCTYEADDSFIITVMIHLGHIMQTVPLTVTCKLKKKNIYSILLYPYQQAK